MKIFKKLWDLTLTSKIVNVFKSLYDYIHDYNLIGDTLYSDSFKLVIKKYLNINLKKDWLGRLYGIINPDIDINGNYNINNIIIELDDERTNNNDYVKNYIYKQLQLISDLFKINRLYDYINIEIKHVGPVEYDNYLFVIDIVNRQQFTFYLKKILKQLLIYGIIALSVILINIYIF